MRLSRIIIIVLVVLIIFLILVRIGRKSRLSEIPTITEDSKSPEATEPTPATAPSQNQTPTPTSVPQPSISPTPAPAPPSVPSETSSNYNLGSGNYEYSLSHGGRTRKYNVYAPPVYSPNNQMAAVIYLHGGGGSINAAYNDKMDKSADKNNFLLIVPTGTGPIPDKLLTWNTGSWVSGASCCGYAGDNNIDDVGFISKVITEVKSKFNVGKVYAVGISNGALMSFRLACNLSNKISGIAAVGAPGALSECNPQNLIPIMYIHGTADPCAPYNGGPGGNCIGKAIEHDAQSAETIVNKWKSINQTSNNPQTIYQNGQATCLRYLSSGNNKDVAFCKIEGGGHTWPSGAQYLPASRVGPVSYDISFDQIWNFFNN